VTTWNDQGQIGRQFGAGRQIPLSRGRQTPHPGRRGCHHHASEYSPGHRNSREPTARTYPSKDQVTWYFDEIPVTEIPVTDGTYPVQFRARSLLLRTRERSVSHWLSMPTPMAPMAAISHTSAIPPNGPSPPALWKRKAQVGPARAAIPAVSVMRFVGGLAPNRFTEVSEPLEPWQTSAATDSFMLWARHHCNLAYSAFAGSFGDGELNPHPKCRSLQLSVFLSVSNLGSTPLNCTPELIHGECGKSGDT
jgi:hypothetical protein